MKKIALFIMSLVLSACATQPSPEEIARLKSLDYGTYPDKYDEIIRDFVLHGNSSANAGLIPELLISPGEKNLEEKKIEYMFEPKKASKGKDNGYAVCAKVPGKAAFGIKTAYLWYFLIVDGKVAFYEKPTGDSFSMGYMAGKCDALKKRTYL